MSNPSESLFSFDLFFKEISIFFKKIFKKIFLSIIAGIIIGATVSLFSKNLIIASGSIGVENSSFIELDSWEKFKNEIPILINLYIKNHEINESELEIYKVLSNSDWWNRNTVVTYTKSILSENNKISKIIVTSSAQNQASARMLTITALNLIKSRWPITSITEKIYDKNLADYSRIMQLIEEDNLAINQALNKKKFLQKLLQNNGGNTHEGYYPLNISQEYSKFLPIKSQIIALDIDLYEKKRSIEKFDSYLAYRQYLNDALNELQSAPQCNYQNTFDCFAKIINIFEECITKMSVESKCAKNKYELLGLEDIYKQLYISEVQVKTSFSFVFLSIIKYIFLCIALQSICQLIREYMVGAGKNEER